MDFAGRGSLARPMVTGHRARARFESRCEYTRIVFFDVVSCRCAQSSLEAEYRKPRCRLWFVFGGFSVDFEKSVREFTAELPSVPRRVLKGSYVCPLFHAGQDNGYRRGRTHFFLLDPKKDFFRDGEFSALGAPRLLLRDFLSWEDKCGRAASYRYAHVLYEHPTLLPPKLRGFSRLFFLGTSLLPSLRSYYQFPREARESRLSFVARQQLTAVGLPSSDFPMVDSVLNVPSVHFAYLFWDVDRNGGEGHWSCDLQGDNAEFTTYDRLVYVRSDRRST